MPLPKSGTNDAIMVVVDRFTKMAHFIPTQMTLDGKEAARLFFLHVVRNHGLPESVVSDRDSRFTGMFWSGLMNSLGTKLLFSSAYHPETDGQTERVNRVLEDYLRLYVAADQSDWAELLPIAELCYNNAYHSSLGMSPFEALMGRNPRMPDTFAPLQWQSVSLEEYQVTQREAWERAKVSLKQSQDRYKAVADLRRTEVHYEVGDLVWLKTENMRLPPHLSHKLASPYIGPYKIVKKVGEEAYRLKLPKEMRRVHSTFHTKLLKKYFEDPSRGQSIRPAPELVDGEEEWEVETILNARLRNYRNQRKKEYLIKWKGYPLQEATWESAANLKNAQEAIQEFEARQRT